MDNILQIIPADGWYALYTQNDGTMTRTRLVCWALVVDEDGVRYVGGMDAAGTDIFPVELCEQSANFARYVHVDDNHPQRRTNEIDQIPMP